MLFGKSDSQQPGPSSVDKSGTSCASTAGAASGVSLTPRATATKSSLLEQAVSDTAKQVNIAAASNEVSEKILESRKLKSVDLVERHMRRIREVQPVINAVVEYRYEEADTEAADQIVASGTLTPEQLAMDKPFLGVPLSTKDCYAIKGLVSNKGQYPPARDHSLDACLVAGPMCRYAQDLEPMLDIMAGPRASLVPFNTESPNFGESAHFCGFYACFAPDKVASQLGLTGQLGLATASAASDRAGGPASCEMSASGHSAMDTSPARDQQPTLDRSSGRMVVAVPRTLIDETPENIAGWVVATQRGKKATLNNAETPQQVSAPQPGKKAAQPTRAQIIKKREHECKMAAEKAGKSGQSKARFSRKDEFPDLSPSKQEGRRKSRSKSRGRSPSCGRSESRDRRRSPSRDGGKLWSDIARGGAKGEKDVKERQRSRTPARKPQNNSLASKMMQLESTIKLLQETVKQQQETMKQQKELIARFTSQQHGNQSDTPWSVGTAQQTASFTQLGTPVMPPPPPSPQSLEQGKTPCQKARRSSVIESDEDEHLNMNTGDDETESISSISTLHSRDTDTQGSLNYGARFKHINARLNRQDKCTKEISQKADKVASAMKNFKNDVKADFAKLEAREEARINTGFEEMKHFMVQLLQEEMGKLGHGSRTAESYWEEAPKREEVSKQVARRLVVLPLPVARARALAETYADDAKAVYVDAAKHQRKPKMYVAAVVRATDGKVLNACSVRATSAEQAEEAAIALALSGIPEATTILSDSRTAIANFGRGSVGTPAASLLPRTKSTTTHLRWFPAHVGVIPGGAANRNEEADVVAPDEADFLDPDPLLDYGGILSWYREGRRALPGPHPRLGRREGVILRQLHTGIVLTPALARHVCPGLFESATCSVCARELATLAHVLWGCDACAGGTVGDSLPPDMEHYISSPDHQAQLQAIQRLDAALARQKRTEATPSS
ncbi:hypothetical protein HPB49_003048 [Dermacentor silvarum]|uniref:Uncharacterized protein n=1 Tax=Dermacentor silvarum TaxID=543639 RepID=A0ACB8DTG1_DERSI|nr:hypothetical protein HPB49_003048 [Dermacentor silvarum]